MTFSLAEFANELVPMIAKLPTLADPLGDLAREELKRAGANLPPSVLP